MRTDEVSKKRGVSIERSKRVQKKVSWWPITGNSKYSNNEHNIEVFYKKWEKYNEIQLTKQINGLKQ